MTRSCFQDDTCVINHILNQDNNTKHAYLNCEKLFALNCEKLFAK